MNNKQCVNLKRIALLFKSDISLSRPAVIITIVTITAMLLLYNLINPDNVINISYNLIFFEIALFGGGFWLSSNAFRGFRDSGKNYFFLMLPASNLEKFLVRWFFTSIGYAVSLLIFYSVFYWLIALITFIVAGKNYFNSIPFSLYTWQLIFNYMFLQSIFLLGSIYFKKYALIKTILVVSCVSIVLVVLIAILNYWWIQAIIMQEIIMRHSISDSTIFVSMIKIIFTCIFLVAAYWRLKEVEA